MVRNSDNLVHVPVLLDEVIKNLHIKKPSKACLPAGRYIDATLGAGGYTKEIAKLGGEVLSFEADPSMIEIAKKNLGNNKVRIVNANFKDLKKVAENEGFDKVDGIVFDLGVSNVHFSDEMRGFSFQNPNAILDMRLNPSIQSVKAIDLLNILRIDQLEMILGKSLAKKVEEFRKTKKFETVGDFLSLFPEKRGKLHPATKSMMMLRIAVNSELENLKEALPQALELLKPGGILEVVSFHSLEDRVVKNFMKNGSKIIRPSDEEVKRNPKSRSAILRVIQK